MGNDSIIKRYKIDFSKEPNSRYKRLYRMVDDLGDEYIESYDLVNIPESGNDLYHEVMAGQENRLDLVSYEYYNTPMLWWVIAEASNIMNPLEVPVGTVLRIPPKSVLYGVRGVVV